MNKSTIKKISDIPYCGSIDIQGIWSSDYLEVESYEGTTNPENDFGNPRYFRATWGQSNFSRGGEYKDYMPD